MSATISVLVPVYDNAAYLRAALGSALAQTRPADEIIVVDDGSSDDSASVAEAMPGVRTIRETHRGVAATRNIALEHARGDLVAWLDADDIWMPDKLAVQAGYLDAHPEVGMTFSHQRLLLEPGVSRPYWVRDEMVAADSPVVGTCSMVVRRHLFTDLGGFDVGKKVAEDTDWIFRARNAGVAHVTQSETLLIRRVHARNTSTIVPLDKPKVLGMLRAAIARKRAAGDPT